MCGIVGVLARAGELPDTGTIVAAAERLRRRGPDDAGLWAEERAARGKRAGAGRGAAAAAAYLLKNLVLRGGLLDGPGAWRFHALHARYVALKYDRLRALTRPQPGN